jgi:glycosyltransferase involved in cell wall biosynthesis
MNKSRVAWIISDIDRWQPFEWVAESFADSSVTIDYFLLSDKKGFFFDYIEKLNFNIRWFKLASKRSYPRLILQLIRALVNGNYDVVHCHFLDANICGLTAAYLSGIPKRVYTRHHSTFHHYYAPRGVYLDKYCNLVSTDIIAITEKVKEILINKEKVKPSKIRVIHHGFDFRKITKVSAERIDQIAMKYGLKDRFIIGVVSRFIEWKGVQFIIPAFRKFLEHNPESVLVMANARGGYKNKIVEFLSDIPTDNYRLIPFEKDIYALFKNFDIFVHTPVDEEVEAFGQIYIESLALNIPSIFTLSGIGNEILEDKKNCMLVPHKDDKAILNALLELNQNKSLVHNISQEAGKTVNPAFTIKKMHDQLLHLYLN